MIKSKNDVSGNLEKAKIDSFESLAKMKYDKDGGRNLMKIR